MKLSFLKLLIFLGPGKSPGSSSELSDQLIRSSNNSIQYPMNVPKGTLILDELAARALNKDTWHVAVHDSPDSRRRPENGKVRLFQRVITQEPLKIQLI